MPPTWAILRYIAFGADFTIGSSAALALGALCCVCSPAHWALHIIIPPPNISRGVEVRIKVRAMALHCLKGYEFMKLHSKKSRS